jgi:hypothetical protein
VPPLTAPRKRCGQLRSPDGCLHQHGEVDVVEYTALMEVRAVARDKLIADRRGGLRPEVERPLDVPLYFCAVKLTGTVA